MDHFARLGLPAALDLEPASLDKAYFALQRQWHPDRFVARPPDERARASSDAAWSCPVTARRSTTRTS